jgi:hypothetical protein
MRTFWLVIALSAALSVLFPAAKARAQWVTVAPPEGGFSAALPAQAEFRRLPPKPKVDTRAWLANNGQLLGIIGVTDHDAHIDPERELELDVKNFLTSDKGYAQIAETPDLQQRARWAAARGVFHF